MPRPSGALVAVVATASAACDVRDSASLQITGLKQHPEFNGEYLRDGNVLRQPTFWQSSPQNSCGSAMRKGDCGALQWKVLPAGNASQSECLKACEGELHHGCCRFSGDTAGVSSWLPGKPGGLARAPPGCALGHGNVVFEVVPSWASAVAKCHGRAVVLQVDGTWRLAPPNVLDTSAQERQSSPISIAEGLANESLTSGFHREAVYPRRYVDADANIQLHCPEEGQSGFSHWMLTIPISVVVLCSLVVAIFVCRRSMKARRLVAGPHVEPEIQENPIDDWDTMLGQGHPSSTSAV